MKTKSIFNIALLSLFLFSSFQLVAQKEKQLKAYLDHKQFYAPNIGNYVEIQLQFIGYTLNYKGVGTDLQGEVAVQLTVRNSEKVVASDAYRLNSPLMRDSVIEDFYDLKRFPLAAGTYELEISLQDLNSDKAPMVGKQEITIEDWSKSPHLSNLQTAESIIASETASPFNKSGFEIIPRISNYYPNVANYLPVYLELYSNSENQETFGLKQTIIHNGTKLELDQFTRFSKHDVNQVQPVIRNIDITQLYSGEYQLQFSLISKENEVISTSSFFFERMNEKEIAYGVDDIIIDPAFQASIHEDSIEFYMESLIPIARPAEVKNIISILKKKNNEQNRKYIQAFWIQSANGRNPYDAWLGYKRQVQLVQKMYSNNFMDGFETDRGRVYLQYGQPNSVIVRETSPSDYPYEIWVYDKIKQFSNKRFVFYNPDLVNNAHRLLHSDMVGELQNYRWQQQLAKRNSPNQNIDNPNDGNDDHFGGNSRELFEQR